MKKIGLLPRLLLGIIAGIAIGATGFEFLTRLMLTFRGIFGNFLGFIIPLLIIGFVVTGIADLGSKAGKLLGITTGIAYLSTLLAGAFAYIVSTTIFSTFISQGVDFTSGEIVIEPFFVITIPPMMGVMSALTFAFILGLGISSLEGITLKQTMNEFQEIIKKVIEYVIIPLLPFHIAGIFAGLAFTGQIIQVLGVFGGVFVIVILLQFIVITAQYVTASMILKVNPWKAIKKMLPAYFTAIGTQSSAATIPVSLRSAKTIEKMDEEVSSFVMPLCATIHLSGSTIAIISCAVAVMFMSGITIDFGTAVFLIAMLGVTMVAAPGVPGGAIMAALGLLETTLGFTEVQLGLMMAIYIAQDSFGTATNVMGDGAIAMIITKISEKTKEKQTT